MLNTEDRLKEAAEFVAFGIASHVLQSIPVKEPVEITVGQVHDIVGWGVGKGRVMVKDIEIGNSMKQILGGFMENLK